jgi:O-antigen/teichoic acid export membrane protein
VHFAFSSRYWPAGRIVPLMIGALLLHGFFYLFQLSVVYSKRTKFLSLVGALAIVFNVALNLLLIPHWGIFGAACASFLGFAVGAGLMYLCGQRLYFVPYDKIKLTLSFSIFLVALIWTQLPHSRWHGAATAISFLACLGALILLSRKDIAQSFEVLRGCIRPN